MFDINAIAGLISGHCTLCHKKNNISILNGGVCLSDKLEYDAESDEARRTQD